MANTQVQNIKKQANVEVPYNANQSLPATNLSKADPEIKVAGNSNGGVKLSVPEGSKTGFKYEYADEKGLKTTGTIQPFNPGDISIKRGDIQIKRDGKDILINAPENIIIVAITMKADGTTVETPLKINPVATNTQPAAVPVKPEIAQNAVAPKLPVIPKTALEIPSKPTLERPLKVEKAATLESLEAQAKKYDLPDKVVENAKKANINDLSKVKIIDNEYQYCTDSACVSLGAVEVSKKDSSTAVEVPPTVTKPEPQSVETRPAPKPVEVKQEPKIIELQESKLVEPKQEVKSPEVETKAELNLKNIPAGSNLKYSYVVGGMKTSGMINLPMADTAITATTIPGVGRFTNNADGTFKFDQDSRFNGTIANESAKQSFEQKQQSAAVVFQGAKRPVEAVVGAAKNTVANILDRRSNTLHLSPERAKEYVNQHPKENIVVVLTSPAICGPCRSYEPAVDQAINNTSNTTFIIANTGSSYSAPSFNVNSIPTTVVYSQNRPSSSQESTRFSGYRDGQSLTGMLDNYFR